jgi:porin
MKNLRRTGYTGFDEFSPLLPKAGTVLCMALLYSSQAFADPAAPASAAPANTEAPASQQAAAPLDPTFTTGLFASSRATLLGDAGGLRTLLGKYGITLGVTETSEVLGNATGGVRQGATYDGLTTATLQVDTLRAFGLTGGLFNASALQIHGSNLSAENLLNLQTASGIEANRATRLWELWYQQAFMDGAFDIKVGQQSVDQEFIASTGSALFVNTMMGWPLAPSVDLYAGGPAYPLSSLGARIRGQVFPNVTALLGVYDDNPPGGSFSDDSQTRGAEKYGARFNLNTGALIFGELQYAYNQPSAGDVAKDDNKGLPGTYKIGFWYDTGAFPDQRYGTDGLSLADPASNGTPVMHRGNFSVYGVFDQVVYHPDPAEARAVGIFARVMGAPDDRNLISFNLNAGVTLKSPFEGRDNDTAGLGVGYGLISSGARTLDQAAASFAGPTVYSPVRSSETFIEATYQIQLAPWWQVQPDFQYVFNPGGGIVDPADPAKRIGDEAVFGMRTNITF